MEDHWLDIFKYWDSYTDEFKENYLYSRLRRLGFSVGEAVDLALGD